jgi:hypothetical protein
MKNFIALFLFLCLIGFPQKYCFADDPLNGGLTFVYPHNYDAFQSGNVTQGG